MKWTDYLRTALKNFLRQKLRTFLTITAITVGSLSVILMLSLLISVRQSVMDAFQAIGAFNLVTVTRDPNAVSDNPQLISSSNNDPTSDEGKMIDDTTLTQIKNLPHVVDATPILSVWVKTIHLDGQAKKLWSNILAYQPETNVLTLPVLAGRNLQADDLDKIVVGARFVETYGYTSHPQDLIGQNVVMDFEAGGGSAPDWGDLPEQPPMNADKDWYEAHQKTGVEIRAEIVGVADNRTLDDSQNYISLGWARRLMTSVSWQYDDTARKQCEDAQKQSGQNYNGDTCNQANTLKLVKDDMFTKSGYGSIIAKVDQETAVAGVGQTIAQLGYGVTTAQNMIDQMNKVFTMLSLVLGTIGGISLFVAAIGIINTMVMATFERTREIGVMRACGATRATIRHLFTFEAGLLGCIGGVFGMLFSYLFAQLARYIIQNNQADLGNIPLDNVGNFPWWLVLSVIGFTTLIGLLAGVYPAIRASRLNPVDALRYE